MHDLQRDLAVQLRVARAVDHAHRAGAELGLDEVALEHDRPTSSFGGAVRRCLWSPTPSFVRFELTTRMLTRLRCPRAVREVSADTLDERDVAVLREAHRLR